MVIIFDGGRAHFHLTESANKKKETNNPKLHLLSRMILILTVLQRISSHK